MVRECDVVVIPLSWDTTHPLHSSYSHSHHHSLSRSCRPSSCHLSPSCCPSAPLDLTVPLTQAILLAQAIPLILTIPLVLAVPLILTIPLALALAVPLTLVLSPLVVAAVLATCHHGHSSGTSSKSDPRNLAIASSTISAKNAIGIYPMGTDSEFMVPFYPSSVHPH